MQEEREIPVAGGDWPRGPIAAVTHADPGHCPWKRAVAAAAGIDLAALVGPVAYRPSVNLRIPLETAARAVDCRRLFMSDRAFG